MEYRNAKHINNTMIDCEINHPTYGWIPFTCDPNDTGANFDVAELYIRMDTDPLTIVYIPPTQAELDQKAAELVRYERNNLLTRVVDPIVSNPLRWADLTPEQQQAWSNYRRELLDITDQLGFPNDIIWPVKPE
jgi:hypothetical protein